jgi:hypothetical protein
VSSTLVPRAWIKAAKAILLSSNQVDGRRVTGLESTDIQKLSIRVGLVEAAVIDWLLHNAVAFSLNDIHRV